MLTYPVYTYEQKKSCRSFSGERFLMERERGRGGSGLCFDSVFLDFEVEGFWRDSENLSGFDSVERIPVEDFFNMNSLKLLQGEKLVFLVLGSFRHR